MKAWTFNACSALALLCLMSGEWPASAESLLTNLGAIHSITLPHFEPVMPIAPGREEFMRACVACHSPRYVTMQPAFTRHQWEETVTKMIKTYGAPMDEAQARAVVDYLEATHGVVPMAKAAASPYDDDDSAATPSPAAQQQLETFPVLKMAADVAEHLQEVSRGAVVFLQDCAGCHGLKGQGDGVVGQVLLRKPADLTAAQFKIEILSQVLWNGVRGTSMPSWRSLPQTDLSALAAYVQTFHPVAKTDQAPPEILAQGRTLFQKNCAACHGELGDGKSAVAATLSPPPANLKWMQPDFEFALQVLQNGIPGTAMPSWKEQISESDRRALAGFVRSLFEPETPKGGHE